MKKICVFTQTYSNDRKELFDFHNLDEEDIRFRNFFDLNLYSFHNLDQNYKNDLLEGNYFKSIRNLHFLTYDDIAYTETFRKTINYLIDNQVDYVIFLQDDCFTTNKSQDDLDKIYQFIQNNDFDMLNLEIDFSLLKSNVEIFSSIGDLNVYKTNSEDFVNAGLWPFDDGPYVARLSFIIDEIYDNKYYSSGDVWNAENYLNEKIKTSPIQRLITNLPLYSRLNIVGKNCQDRDKHLSYLKERFL